MALCTETVPLSTITADANLSSGLPSSQHQQGDALPQGFSILSGRGGLTNRHPANRVYRRLIQHNKPIYQALQNKQRQVCLIQSIVKSIQASNGRFLRKEGENWIQLSDKEAYEKVKQAIREPDSKYAATCSIKSDQTMTSSCLGDGSSSSSTASTSSIYSQQPSQDSRAPVDADVNYCVNEMEDDDDDIDNVSCFSDFTVDGPVAPLSRGVSAFLDDQAGAAIDASAPFAKLDFIGFRPRHGHVFSLPQKTRGTTAYGNHVILGRKPRKHASSLLEDPEDLLEQQLPPTTIVCPAPTVLMRSMSSDAPWKQQQPQSQTSPIYVAPQPIDLPQICPCKVHQMNTNILAWNLQLQAFLEAQLQGHSPSQV